MSTRHEQRRRAHDETTCDDSRPASLAATLTCARCTPGATGRPCAEHLRKRLAVIRNSARRDFGLRYYAQRLVRVASNGRDQTLDDSDEIVRGTVALREVL